MGLVRVVVRSISARSVSQNCGRDVTGCAVGMRVVVAQTNSVERRSAHTAVLWNVIGHGTSDSVVSISSCNGRIHPSNRRDAFTTGCCRLGAVVLFVHGAMAISSERHLPQMER